MTQLDQPVVNPGTRFVHFFEGRVLTGRDLRDQQQADQEQRGRLGRALGAGVVQGLWVTKGAAATANTMPQLTISSGLAINREGEPLALGAQVELELAASEVDSRDGSEEFFKSCHNAPTPSLPTGSGIYVLTMSPASQYEQHAPKSGLEESGSASGCGRRYNTRGVQFRLVRYEPQLQDAVDNSSLASRSLFRNLLANAFFGTEQTNTLPDDPFAAMSSLQGGEPDKYGALDALNLSSCEVPLAVVYWTATGIDFVDIWSVRRTPFSDAPAPGWPLAAVPRRRSEAIARFYQFQEQVAWLLKGLVDNSINPNGIRAKDYFAYLPPAGLVKLQGAFDEAKFFEDISAPPRIAAHTSRLLPLLDASLVYPALDLNDANKPEVKLFSFSGGAEPDYVLFANASLAKLDVLTFLHGELDERVKALEASVGQLNLVQEIASIQQQVADIKTVDQDQEQRLRELEDAVLKPGTIEGTATIGNHYPLGNVVATNTETNEQFGPVSVGWPSKAYKIEGVPPGEYQLTGAMPLGGTYTHGETVELLAGETKVVNIDAPLGSVFP